MWKQDDAEIVLASLKTDGSQVANLRFCEHTFEIRESSNLRCGQWLSHLRQIVDGEDTALAISKFGDVLSRPADFKRLEESGRKPTLDRGQQAAPLGGDEYGCAAHRKGTH